MKVSKLFNIKKIHTLKQRMFFFSTLLLLIGVPVILYLSFVTPHSAQADWFNNNWLYRQPITVTNNTGSAVSNLQKLFTINTSTLVSAGKLQSNCYDLRFTDQTGSVLPYYIDSGCNTTSTKVWVLITSLPTSTSTIYMYYGNPTAIQGSNSAQFDNVIGLVGYWTMNDGSGTTVTDSSVNANTGTLTGTTDLPTWNSSGKYSSDLTFDGTDDYVDVPYSSSLYPSVISASAWIYPTSNAHVGNIISGGGNSGWRFRYNNTNGTITFFVVGALDSVSTTTSVPLNQWSFIAIVGDSNGLRIYINGQLSASNSQAYSHPNPSGNDVLVGAYSASNMNEDFIGQIDDARVYNRALTASEISNLYNNPGSIATAGLNITYSFGTETQAPGPVAYWKFDEGTGTTAYDSTGDQNNVSLLSGSTWQTKDKCVNGKCLYLNGTSSYASIANASQQHLDIGTNSFTLAAWIRTGNSTGQDIINKNDSGAGPGYLLGVRNSGQILAFIGNGITTYTTNTSITISDNKWHYVTAVFNRGGNMQIYIDGVASGTATNISSISSSNIISASRFTIGADASGNNPYIGFIDEVKVYNYARSANQIQADYFNTLKGSGAVLGAATNQNLSNGLEGYWKADESSGTTTADSSGNGYTGTLAGSPTFVAGKFGNALQFNGSNYASTTLAFPSSGTISLWAYPTTYSNWISPAGWKYQTSGDGYVLIDEGGSGGTGNWRAVFRPGTTAEANIQSSSAIAQNTWNHVVMTWSLSGTTYSIQLYVNGVSQGTTTWTGTPDPTGSFYFGTTGAAGNSSGNNFTGKVDEVRVYNRALSPAEVATLYNYAPGPVAYYNFNEGTGSTVHDISGNNNTGTWNGTSTNHWTAGKYGSAGNFNGTNDYVNAGTGSTVQISGSHTLAAWIYPTNVTTSKNGIVILENRNTLTDGNYSLFIQGSAIGTQGVLGAAWYNGGWQIVHGNTILQTNKWQYVVFTIDSSNNYAFFINGVLDKSGTATASPTITTGSSLWIGKSKDNTSNVLFQGKIDDVRIYNYARSQQQIVEDMNAGAPTGGSASSPLGYWKFDEGYGTTAHNSGIGGSSLNGTLSGATWTSNGKFGRALSFNGTNSKVSLNSTGLSNGSNFTISAWFNTSNASIGTAAPIFVSRGACLDVALYIQNGSIYGKFLTNDSCNDRGKVSTTITGSTWNYVAYTWDGTDAKLYLNGVLMSIVNASGYSPTFSSPLGIDIGGYGDSSYSWFPGIIDDVKIYNSALTASQIAMDYNHNTASVMGSTGTDSSGNPSSSADRAYCPPGDTTTTCAPIGQWNFNEGQGNIVNDVSDSGYTGSWGGSGPNHWTIGKVGYAGNFNGTNDYVSLNNHAISNLSSGSVSFWFKANAFNGASLIYEAGNGFNNFNAALPASSTSTFGFNVGSNTSLNTNAASWKTNQWYFMTITWNGSATDIYVNGQLDTIKGASSTSTGTDNTQFGRYCFGTNCSTSGGYFNGALDQIHVYNYALSQAEVSYDYNGGKPIAEWQFDECQGTTAHDLSGNGYNGTITIGPSGSQTQAGSCYDGLTSSAWYNGFTGKIGHALSFDGTDDYVTTSYTQTNITQYTVSAWVKTTGTGTLPIVQDRGSGTGSSLTLTIGYNGAQGAHAGTVNFGLDSNGIWIGGYTTKTVNDGNWHHIVGVYNSTIGGGSVTASDFAVYIDGQNYPLTTTALGTSGDLLNGLGNLIIGYHQQWSSYYSGLLDDVRIYNYALTSQQISALYNNGAVSF